MQPTVFVKQQEPTNKGLDFEYLKKEGIKRLEELTGEYWTDFNPHDPGITILEQLCYALTDVAFRTDFPVPDLLGQSEFESPIFQQPKDILTVEPLTVIDLRKVFLDNIQELKNIWFIPTTPDEHSLKGLFKIYADLQEPTEDEAVIENVKEKIRSIFASRRNLCEDVEVIEITRPVDVSLSVQVEIDNSHTPEHILAKIYFELDNAFNPDLRFYSLKELVGEGLPIEKIFEGPSLAHGFIKDEDLKEKVNKMPFSEVNKIIMQVEGVLSVKNLAMRLNGEFQNNQLDLTMTQVANLIFGNHKDDENFTLQFFKGSLPIQNLDRNTILRKYNELKASKKRVYHQAFTEIEWEKGRNIQLQDYYSLQNQFPIIYGIGEEGIPNRPDEKRKAQAKQLKGYLLIFEQIIVNYLAQLAQAKNLFSPTANIQNSYFYQYLDAVPDVQTLYQENYKEMLPEIMAKEDNFLDRRNRFLDFFLAMHGEDWKDYSLTEYLGLSKKSDALAQEIKSKLSFLSQLVFLGQNRAQAFDYLESVTEGQNFSGAEIKMLGLLGLNNQDSTQRFIFTEERLQSDWQIFELYENPHDYLKWQELTANPFKSMSVADFDKNFDWIDEEDLPLPTENPIESANLLIIKDFKKMPTTFFREGINLKLYKLGQVNQQGDYFLFFKDDKEWLLLGKLKEYEQGLQVVANLKAWLEAQNAKDETLFIIEHILLRPDLEDSKFGFYVLDEKGTPALKSVQRFSFSERKEILKRFEPYLYDYNNYAVERTLDGDFEIVFTAEGEEWQMVSLRKDISVQAIHEYLEQLFNFLSNKNLIVSIDEKISFYCQNGDKDPAIEEDFFNFHVSAIFPAWSARFGSVEFQERIETLLQECLPANVLTDARWFTIEKMKEFEYIYKQWTEQKRLNLPDLKEYEKKLLHFLYN